jgi:5-methylcytosine-specific restriction protein A
MSEIKKQMISDTGGQCASCKERKDHLELDHKIPLWNGGTNDDDNLQILCYECHKEKTRAESKLYHKLHPQQIIIISQARLE